MARKKTREEKLKSAKRTSPQKVTYSYVSDIKAAKTFKLSTAVIDYHKKEIRLIIFASLLIFSLNILLYFLLKSNLVKLGFLGY